MRIDKYIFICSIYRKHEICGPLSSKVTIYNLSGRHDVSEYARSYSEIVVGNVAQVEFKYKRLVGDCDDKQHIMVWIMGKKHKKVLSKDVAVKMAVNCRNTGYSEQWILPQQEVWKQLGVIHHVSECENVCYYRLEVDIGVCVLESPLLKLYNDNVFTDFHLSSSEGSIAVHKACLAAHSDMFRTMFGGEWKETVESRVEPNGVTLQTLQHLKDYLYLGSLPEQGLRELLLLAMWYMIDSLKAQCIISLANRVTKDDLFDLLEFARNNEIPELTLAITQLTPKGVIEDISEALKKLDVKEEQMVDCNENP